MVGVEVRESLSGRKIDWERETVRAGRSHRFMDAVSHSAGRPELDLGRKVTSFRPFAMHQA